MSNKEWVLVPREPTEPMLRAGVGEWLGRGAPTFSAGWQAYILKTWHAMLAAAPKLATSSNPPAPSAPSVVMVGVCTHERLGAMTATGYMSCVDCRWMRPMTPEEFAHWNPPFEERSK